MRIVFYLLLFCLIVLICSEKLNKERKKELRDTFNDRRLKFYIKEKQKEEQMRMIKRLRDSFITEFENGAHFIQPIDIKNETTCNEINKEFSRHYYKLDTKKDLISHGSAIHTGDTVALRCPHCLKDSTSSMAPKMWFKKPIPYYTRSLSLDNNNTYFERVIGDMHNLEEHNRIVISLDHILVIKDFSINDVGSYICVDSETFSEIKKEFTKNRNPSQIKSILKKNSHIFELNDTQFQERFSHLFNSMINYDETKLNNDIIEFIFAIRFHLFITEINVEHKRIKFPTGRSDTFFDSFADLSFYISWSGWSDCPKCVENATRTRLGDCYVKYERNTLSGKMNPQLNDIQQMFHPFGWPCRLNLHLNYISTEKLIIQDYYDEMPCEITNKAYCEEYKKTTEEIRINDAMDFMQASHNGGDASIEQYRQTTKNFKFMIHTIDVKRFEDESVHLICPHTNSESNVYWKKDNALILHSSKKTAKFRIDAFNALHIIKIKLKDSGRYECEFEGKTKISIDLKVVPKRTIIQTSQSDYYPQYHKFLYAWILLLSVIFFAIILLKCIRFCCFYKKIKIERLKVKTFSNEKANEYIKLNMERLLGFNKIMDDTDNEESKSENED